MVDRVWLNILLNNTIHWTECSVCILISMEFSLMSGSTTIRFWERLSGCKQHDSFPITILTELAKLLDKTMVMSKDVFATNMCVERD